MKYLNLTNKSINLLKHNMFGLWETILKYCHKINCDISKQLLTDYQKNIFQI